MAQITVKVRKDIGDPGIHIKHGQLTPGESVSIDEEDFAEGLFERPKGFISPLEQKDKDRAAEEKQRVGNYDPPSETAPAAPAGGEVNNA